MEINPNRIDVWRIHLDVDEFTLEELKHLLDDKELEREKGMKVDENRRRFIASHGILRKILSLYTGITPDNIRFHYNSNGKPKIVPEEDGIKLFFNLTHSGDFAMVAVTADKPVGIDIEKVKKDIDYRAIAKRYFKAQECETLLNLPTEQQLEAFYRCWTRKESFIKGKGGGVWQMIEKINVSLVPGEPAALLENTDCPEDCTAWHITDLDTGYEDGSYIGSLAVKNNKAEILYLNYKQKETAARKSA